MPALNKAPVLDHGYVALVGKWGSEEQIIEAARMSTDKGFQGWGTPEAPGDEKLLRYLWENAHQTPFEMAGLTIEVQAPIFVFREWHRHRVPFGYNELSARYTPMPDVSYVPTLERCMLGSDGVNKQAGTIKDAEALTEEKASKFLGEVEYLYTLAEIYYQRALKAGVPKELARVVIPVGRYSRMRATGNLRGWLAFLTLRDAPNAQWEIRQFAKEVANLVKQEFPRVYEIYTDDKGARVATR